MIYEIINPSDPYTIVADDFKVATVACLLLGRGQYGFEPLEEGGESVPLMLFGTSEKWFQRHFQQSLEDVIDDVVKNQTQSLVDCFESCLIGKLGARREYESALELIESPENKEQFRAQRHNDRRSSLNDIGGRAYKMAKNLRDGLDRPIEPAPQQIFASQ